MSSFIAHIVANKEAYGIALVILQLLLALLALLREAARRRREATLSYFYESNSHYAPLWLEICASEALDKIASSQPIETNEEELVRQFLAYMEMLAAAYNMNIFDRELVSRVGAPYFKRAFDSLEPFISSRRVKFNDPDRYSEFEEMVEDLERQYLKNRQRLLSGRRLKRKM